MDAALNHVWVVLLVVTVASALLWWRHAQKYIERSPEDEPRYRRLILGYLILGSLPWVVMGLGLVVGDVTRVLYYLRPRQASVWVLPWYVTVIFFLAPGMLWVLAWNASPKLIYHPGVAGVSTTKPWHVNAIACGGFALGIFAVLVILGMEVAPDILLVESAREYVTVFVIDDGFRQVILTTLWALAVPVGLLPVSLVWLRRQKARGEDVGFKKKWDPRFLLVWSLLYLGIGGTAFALNLQDSHGLARAYWGGQAQVAEGTVRILRLQPFGGHAPGDLIEIDGVQLTINYFRVTPAYAKTVAMGGALREGVQARVWHHDGVILRVDVRGEE